MDPDLSRLGMVATVMISWNEKLIGDRFTLDIAEAAKLSMPMTALHDHARCITESRDRELAKHIRCFYECGVTLDRMHIVDNRNFSTTTLYVDGIARFQWRIKEYRHG